MRRHGGIAVACALAALSPARLGPGQAYAAEVRTHLSVTATVVERVNLHVVHQARALTISAEDIGRGYVEVRGASRIEIAGPRQVILEFRPTGSAVASFRVTGFALTAEFGAEGASIVQAISRMSPVELSYVFVLASDTRAGRYPWPLALTVYPL